MCILSENKTQYVQYCLSTPTCLVVQITDWYGGLDITGGFRVILTKTTHFPYLHEFVRTYRYYAEQILMIHFPIARKIRGNALILQQILNFINQYQIPKHNTT